MPKQELISLIITILGVGIFAVLFVFLYSKFVKIQVSEVLSGKEDSVLLTNILKKDEEKLKKSQKHGIIIKWLIYAFLLVIIVPFLITAIISIKNNGVVMIGGRSIMVVASGSMSYKNEVNDYLIENNLNDQFDTYDIIVIKQVNNSSELELYDTIAYYNGTENIIHRIVNINDNGTYITRGDANTSSDPVLVEFDDINKANKDWIYSHIDKNKYKTYITKEQIVNDLKKIFGDELNINIEEDQNLIPTNSASNIPKLVEKNKYFLTPMGDTINVMYAIDTIEKREKNYIVDVVEYGEDIDNENILDEKYAIYSYKNNNWNKTFNLEENQSGKDFIIIENILKNKSDYNMYQIVILQENNNLYVKKIQRK